MAAPAPWPWEQLSPLRFQPTLPLWEGTKEKNWEENNEEEGEEERDLCAERGREAPSQSLPHTQP